MQTADPAAPKRRLRQRAQLLVQGIDAAPAAEQTETGFDAGQVAPRVQADRQSAVIVDAALSVASSRGKCLNLHSHRTPSDLYLFRERVTSGRASSRRATAN